MDYAEIRDRLADQILAQGTTGQWSGQGFGSAEANARDMANILANIGITDIRQFGEVDVPADVAVQPVYENRTEYVGGEEGYVSVPYIVGYTGPDGKPVDSSLVKEGITSTGEGDNSSYVASYTAPLGKAKAYGNKVTGQAVPNTYSERQTGNAWGGTFAGSGNTGYRVQFVEDTPVFYTTHASSNDLVNLLADNKLLNIAANMGAAFFGGPAGVAALQLAQDKNIGDALKAGAITWVGGQVAGGVSTSPAVIDTLGTVGAKIAGSVTSAVVTGKDPITAAIGGGLGTMAGESVGLTGDTAATVGTSVVSGIAASLRGQDVTDAMIAGAVSGFLSNKNTPGKVGSDATEFEGSLAKETVDDVNNTTIDVPTIDTTSVDDTTIDVQPIDATASEGSLAKETKDDGFLSKASDAISKSFDGMSVRDSLKVGLVAGLTTKTTPPEPDFSLGSRTNNNTSSANISNEDIYKDAPIKGYHMKQNSEGRYIPYIGDRALLAKGGFVSKRK